MKKMFLAAILLTSLIQIATAEQVRCKALVLYDSWVQHDGINNYKDSRRWEKFRSALKERCSVEFTKHVNLSMLKNYDVLFILTPDEDIPDDEVNAIINWVKSGGCLVITQDGNHKFANEISEKFGIKFRGRARMEVRNFVDHPITRGLGSIVGATGSSKIIVFGNSKVLGLDSVGHCFIAVNESAGCGKIIAIGDELLWMNSRIEHWNNAKLLDNIVQYCCCCKKCSIPEISPFGLMVSIGILLATFIRKF